jgi:hypothetical protein
MRQKLGSDRHGSFTFRCTRTLRQGKRRVLLTAVVVDMEHAMRFSREGPPSRMTALSTQSNKY